MQPNVTVKLAADKRKTFNMPKTIEQPATAAQLEPLVGWRIWSTKYCLTGPITEHELGETPVNGMAVVKSQDGMNGVAYLHGSDWHWNKRDATERFDVMLAAKLASLAKQIRKLEAMEESGPTFNSLD